MGENFEYLLREARGGNRWAESALYGVAWLRLRQVAGALMGREAAGHTLQPTALVSEFFLRAPLARWRVLGEEDFFHLSARVMRQVLVDHARRRRTLKRTAPESISEVLAQARQSSLSPEMRISVNAAVEELRENDAIAAATVWQRCVEGFTWEELSQAQGREVWRVRADYDYGIRWLCGRIRPPHD